LHDDGAETAWIGEQITRGLQLPRRNVPLPAKLSIMISVAPTGMALSATLNAGSPAVVEWRNDHLAGARRYKIPGTTQDQRQSGAARFPATQERRSIVAVMAMPASNQRCQPDAVAEAAAPVYVSTRQ
jgi:hypothetical protein